MPSDLGEAFGLSPVELTGQSALLLGGAEPRPPATLVAYLAGIVDGEGCIGVHAHGARRRQMRYYQVWVRVEQVDRAVPDLLRRTFGGTVCHHTDKRPDVRNTFQWGVAARVAEQCLRQLLPYLRIKRPQAENALAFMDLTGPRGRNRLDPWVIAKRDALYLRARELNRIGAAAILAELL